MNRLARQIFSLSLLSIAVSCPTSAVAVAPIVSSNMPDTTVVEENPPVANYRDLNSVFFDAEDGNALTFTIEDNTNPALVNVTIDADSALDLSFTANGFGTSQIILRATDTEALFVEDTLVVTVSAVNDIPFVASAIPDTLVLVDSGPIGNYVDLNDVFSDIEDGSGMTFTVQDNNAPGAVNVVIDPDSALDIGFTPDTHAIATIVIRATDSEGLSVDETFIVRVHRTFWIINADRSGHEPSIQSTVDWSLDGDTLMLTDGTYTGPGNSGISFDGKDIVITSENGPEVTIIDLESAARGFIMDNVGPSTVLSNITIMNGSQNQGACIKMTNASPFLTGLILTGNAANGDGGAIYLDVGSNATVTDCRIIGNSASTGGGIYANLSSPLIDGCTIIENNATAGGAGIHLRNASNATITNSIIAFNTQGPGFECTGGSNPTVSCSNVFGNEGGDAICGIDLGGNISADPLFCGSPGSQNVYIEGYSPCAPGNNTCGAQIGALPVGCASGPVLVDASATVYPPATFADAPDLVLHIGLDNISSVGVMLETSSTILFSDSTNVFSATLANRTYVPGGAQNFTATFSPTAVPAGMASPSLYDLRLSLAGVDDSSKAYADTFLTTGRNAILVDTPKIVVSSLPLDVKTVHPGQPGVQVLTLDFQNGYGSDRVLDSLVVTNISSGPGTPAQIDGEINRLFLFDDVDIDRILSPADTVITETTFNANIAIFELGGGWSIPAAGGASLLVVADIDSFNAHDSDRIDAAVASPLDVVFQGDTEINQDFSPLYPLNSFGHAVVDGMAAHQIRHFSALADTLRSGSADVLLMSLTVPQNGYAADTLIALSVKDFAGDFSPADIAALRIYLDDGSGSFDPSADTNLGKMVYSGDRYEISGLNEPIGPAIRLFIVADVAASAANSNHFRPGIPVDGIDVISSNDGPVDSPVVSSKTFAFKNTEVFQLTNLPLSSYTPGRGDKNAALLYFEIYNNTLSPATLDSLVLTNTTRGIGTQSDLDNTFSRVRIYQENGNGRVDAGDVILADGLSFSAGSLVARSLGLAVPMGEFRRLLVASDIDSFCSADGDTIAAALFDSSDIGIAPVYPLIGSFPIATPTELAIDGMRKHELAVYPSIDSLIVTGGNDILVLDVGIPANGYAVDTLESLIVRNEGSASSEHFTRLALYADGGDGLFDGGAGDDIHLGDMTENPAEPGGRSFLVTGLDAPLDFACGARKHFYIGADIAADYLVAGTIQMSIPAMGIGVRSANDGPIDGSVAESSIIMIPRPDQLTAFPYPVGDQIRPPGSRNNLNFGVGFFNGYTYAVELDQMRLYQVGTLSSAEIDSVFAYADVDSNGLFDPNADTRLAALGSTGASYVFENLGQSLPPGEISYIFVSYDLPLAVTDFSTFDLRLFDPTDLAILPPGTEIEGDFPVNSPGTDTVDGMIAQQISIGHVPSYNASPNNQDILAMSFVVPANGIWSDKLEHITMESIGTAFAGADISELRLWREAGGHPSKFDRGLEAPLAFLSWTGSSWRNTFSVNEPIPTSGLRVHVTFSVAATPNDGATFQARLPIGGIEVQSSNDGPIDSAIINSTFQTISTDPLITTLMSDRLSYSTGQPIELSMIARNEGVDTLYGVRPSAISISGDAAASILSGPAPATFDILPGADTTIVWIFSADTVGEIEFCGFAYSGDSSDVSVNTCTETLSILNRAGGVSVSLVNRSPASANTSQKNVDLFSLTVDYSSADSLFSPLHFDGLDISMDDGSGVPIAANAVFSGIVISEPSGSDFSFLVKDSTESTLTLQPASPLPIQPGSTVILDVTGHISDTALLAAFRTGIQDPDGIRLMDANDGGPAPANSSDTFPWWTTPVTANSAAESLLVSSNSGSSLTANTGQENLHIFSIGLLNPGNPLTAREILTDLRFGFYDTTGTAVQPSIVINTLRIDAGSTTLFDGEPSGSSGNVFAANLTTPLVLSPNALQTIDIYVSVKNFPQAPGFHISLDSPGAVVARDINTVSLVYVAAADPAGNDFPIRSDRVVFQLPANDVTAAYTDLLPEAVLPGLDTVPVMELAIKHDDSGSTSSIRVDSLALQFTDSGGRPVFPGNVFSSIYVIHGADTVSACTTPSNTTPYAECGFDTPVAILPGSTAVLNVVVDIKTLYAPASIEVRLEQTGITVRDVNDGSRIFGISGQFPFVAGPVTLQLPSENARAGLLSMIPANISAKEPGVEVFKLTLDNGDPNGHSAIELNALHVRVEDSKGHAINPSSVANKAILVTSDSVTVAGRIESNEIVFSLPTGTTIVPAASSDTLSVLLDFETSLSNSSFRFVIDGAASIETSDYAAQTPINTTESSGQSFPLVTGWTTVLANNVYAAYTNYPNPFAAGREKTTVTYYLEQKSTVTLKLYTIWGKPVATLLDNKTRDPGLHQDTAWDGRNGDGDVVNNGVYYLVLEIRGENGSDTSIKRKVGVVR